MLRFLQDNFRWIAGGFLLTFFSSFGQTFFIGLSGEELRAKFSLSDGQFGMTYMVATLASAATLPFLGRILDKTTGRKVTWLVIPCLSAACLLIAYAPNVAVMVVALYLLRLFGQGMMTHTAFTETGRWFASNRGRATSLVAPGVEAGTAILPVSFAIAAGTLGWQAAWVCGALALVFVTLPMVSLLWAREREPQSAATGSAPERTARDWRLGEVLRDPLFYVLLACVLAPPFIGTTIFFHQDYLVDLRGYSPLAFASAFPVMAVTSVCFALICGQLVDLFGAVRILPFFLLPLALASITAGLLETVWGVYVFMFLIGVSNGFTSTLLGALWPEVYGVRYLGSVRSVIVSAMVFSTALGPGLTGALIDAGTGLPVQLAWMSVWCLAACMLLGFISPRLRARSSGSAPVA